MTSRSNWAKVIRMLSIMRPEDVLVLISWVTLTKLVLFASKNVSNSAKLTRERLKRSILYTTTMSIFPASMSSFSLVNAGRFRLPPLYPPSS